MTVCLINFICGTMFIHCVFSTLKPYRKRSRLVTSKRTSLVYQSTSIQEWRDSASLDNLNGWWMCGSHCNLGDTSVCYILCQLVVAGCRIPSIINTHWYLASLDHWLQVSILTLNYVHRVYDKIEHFANNNRFKEYNIFVCTHWCICYS